ncbi:hypothetical protein K438DRAFT_1955648 [Mycena galopus ATCC 62051]|nr:hypothetical protein K438DRAFT_1955648 [Mycena galopus ATCC 62051]
MSPETVLNGPDHRDPLPTRHVTNVHHVTSTLAARQPTVPHSLFTCAQKATAVAPTSPMPDSPLTLLPSSVNTTTSPTGTPRCALAPAYDSDTTSSSPELPARRVMSTNGAAVLDLPPTKLPLLHEGETTQSQLRQLEVHCANYFSLKTIASDKQVANVIGCFCDYCITTWLENDAERAAAIALDFKAFMAMIRERLLPMDWERSIKQDMQSRKQGKTETFLTFLTAIEHANSLLINTPSFLDEAHVHTLLESNMLVNLSDDLADDGKAADEKIYKKWCDIVKRKDNVRVRNITHLNEIADDCAKREHRTTNTNRGDDRPAKRHKRDENAAALTGRSSSNGTASNGASLTGEGKRCPKLTEEERDLLTANHGCTRCRMPFVGHGDERDKTCPWPNPTSYKHVTQATVNAAAATLTADQRTKYGVKAKAAAAAGTNPNPNTIVAVGFARVEDPDDSVDSTIEVSEPHLFWDFRMEGPMSNLPIPVRGLIDNGAHLVLIHEDLVDCLDLRRQRLHEPVPVSAAFTDCDDPPPLTEYVHFRALSGDLSYETKTVCALILSNLCAPVILGLPFLKHNSIVVDHADRTVIDKLNNYNLLDPVIASPPPPPKPRLRELLKKTKADHKLLADELHAVCATRLQVLTDANLFETVREVDVVAAVRERIDTLVEVECRQKLGDKIKSDYKPIFEPIPHVDDLPSDVLCEIKIKDAYKPLSKRTYQSPRKYKDAWQTLIQKHLDAGHIRPSNSSFASPAFLIPKADKTALPRWGNDFRDINANTVHDVFPLPRVD